MSKCRTWEYMIAENPPEDLLLWLMDQDQEGWELVTTNAAGQYIFRRPYNNGVHAPWLEA